MNYKPNHSILIAYLYGELDKDEKEKVEAYINSSPEAAKELEELEDVRNLLGKLPDKEVINPFYSWSDADSLIDKRFNMNNRWGFLKPVMGIAASIILIMIVGVLTNTRINFRNQGIVISFGDQLTQPALISQSEVQNLVKSEVRNQVTKSKELFLEELQKIENNLDTRFVSNSDHQLNSIKNVIDNQLDVKEERIQKLVRDLQRENLKILAEYLEHAGMQQEFYIQGILSDFSLYIENQREEDLHLIEVNLRFLKDNSDLQFKETGQILASIINTVNTQDN